MGVSSAAAVFDQLDLDKSGTLTASEISTRLSNVGCTDDEIESLIFRLDADSDGVITKEEFHAGFAQLPELVGMFGLTEGELHFAASGNFDLDIRFIGGEVVD